MKGIYFGLATLFLLSEVGLGFELQNQLQCGAEEVANRFGDQVDGLEEMGFSGIKDAIGFISEDPTQKALAGTHQSLVESISGKVDRVENPKSEKKDSILEDPDEPKAFEFDELWRVGLFDHKTEEGQKRYRSILKGVCEGLAKRSGFDTAERCLSATLEKLEKTEEFLSQYREESEGFANEKLRLKFPDDLVWKEFHPQDQNVCPRPGVSPRNHRFARDDVMNTNICEAVSHFLALDSLVLSPDLLLYDENNRPVGRIIKMQMGEKVETYYAPAVPNGGLLNPIFFNVFSGGRADEWNRMVEERFGKLRIGPSSEVFNYFAR